MSMLPADAHRVLVCIGRDPLCPCQDGLACHYRDAEDGTKAMPIPGTANDLRCARCGGDGHLAKDCPWLPVVERINWPREIR